MTPYLSPRKRMQAAEILTRNAKADVAMFRRIELRDKAAELWAERDLLIEEAMREQKGKKFTLEQIASFEQLAQAAFDLDWLCGRLYRLSYPVPITVTEDSPEALKCNGYF